MKPAFVLGLITFALGALAIAKPDANGAAGNLKFRRLAPIPEDEVSLDLRKYRMARAMELPLTIQQGD
jgi:hypothetical protein